MHRDSERHKLFSRRAALLAGGKAFLLSTLIGRMYYLQVVESSRYKTLAEENRISLRLLPPPRGPIVDRFGRELAVNQQNYRVVLIPEDVLEKRHSVENTLDALGTIIPVSEGERRRILREVRRKRSFVPVTVRENLVWKDVARIEVNTPDLPGVNIDVGESRHYPHGESLAHVLGYVAAVSEKEQTGDPLLELPGFRIGKAGVEKVYDLPLRGKGGSLQVEVNAIGRTIKEVERQEGQPGAEVALTLDLELQKLAARRLENESGAAVALDITNGDILAMVSTPAYDPNDFNKGLSTTQWKALVSNERAPLINKTIAGQYAPGSTFKMAVALAALEKGVVTPQTEVFCGGSMELGDAEFHCWKRHGHGRMNMVQALSQSCDVYFYEIAKRTGIDRIAAMARRLGLGAPLGFELPGESAGLVPGKQWKQGALGRPWQQGETLLAGIGQGYLLTTPLQLAVMTARLASGRAVAPRLTRGLDSEDWSLAEGAPEFGGLGINAGHLKLVLEGMSQVVNDPLGTAHKARINRPEYEMGGKTGTAQVRRISKAEREAGVRKNDELEWRLRDHALFVGFAPRQAPRYAVAVVVEHGGSGSKAAAPLARDILLEAQRRNSGGVSPQRLAHGDGEVSG